MLTATEIVEPSERARALAEARFRQLRQAIAPDPDTQGTLLHVATGEMLIEAGALRAHIYRVEEGMLCLLEPAVDGAGEPSVLGFALPGDVVGLGHLAVHSISAQATQQCLVTRLPVEEQQRIADADPKIAERLADAVEQELDFLRRRIVHQNADRPLVRLAAFLTTVARNNALEGRDPLLIADSLTCGTVAGLLGIEIDALARLLLELEERGIVVPSAGGLAVLDPAALEALADS